MRLEFRISHTGGGGDFEVLACIFLIIFVLVSVALEIIRSEKFHEFRFFVFLSCECFIVTSM